MTLAEFSRRVALTRMRGRACDAARLVLVDGLSRNAAADCIGVDFAAVSRAVAKIANLRICECCGRKF